MICCVYMVATVWYGMVRTRRSQRHIHVYTYAHEKKNQPYYAIALFSRSRHSFAFRISHLPISRKYHVPRLFFPRNTRRMVPYFTAPSSQTPHTPLSSSNPAPCIVYFSYGIKTSHSSYVTRYKAYDRECTWTCEWAGIHTKDVEEET